MVDQKFPNRGKTVIRLKLNAFLFFSSPIKLTLFLIITNFSITTTHKDARLVFTQVSKILNCGPNSNSIAQKTNTNQFGISSQYSLWGWFKFQGQQNLKTNILILHQAKNNNKTSPNPIYPLCPYSSQDFTRNPSLLSMPPVAINPNCFLGSSNNDTNDLLYVNFNSLTPTDKQPAQFQLEFLFQTDLKNGISALTKKSFSGKNPCKDSWVFFAVSFDYSQGTAHFFYQVFDGKDTLGFNKNIKLSFVGFGLTPEISLSLASIDKNPYTTFNAPFFGQIAYIEMSLFYTVKVNIMWMGYMPKNSKSVNGITSEVMFNRENNGPLTDIVDNQTYVIKGGCSSIDKGDKTTMGLNFNADASVSFDNFSCNKKSDSVQSLSFFLQFSFSEPLPTNFIIVQKGVQTTNNYFAISIVQLTQGSRVIQVFAQNSASKGVWQTTSTYLTGVIYTVIVGLATDMSGGLYAVLLDANGGYFPKLGNSFWFDLTIDDQLNKLTLFNNQGASSQTGIFSFFRYVVLNSASAAIYNTLLISTNANNTLSVNKNITNNNTTSTQTYNTYTYNTTNNNIIYKYNYNSNANNKGNGCLIGSSGYYQSDYCLLCPDDKVATIYGTCVQLCPVGQSTFGTNVCLPCSDLNCTRPSFTDCINNKTEPEPPICDCNDTDPNPANNGPCKILPINPDCLFWTFREVDNIDYQLIPSQAILTAKTNPYQFISINLKGTCNTTSFTLSNDLNSQLINLHLNLTNGTFYDQAMTIHINKTQFNKKNTNCSLARVFSFPDTVISDNGTISFPVFQICNLSKKDITTFNALAITLLAVLFICFLCLICVTCCFWSKTADLGGLWKFFLHILVKLQFVAFMLLLGFHIPCCLRQFLNILYLITIRWDSAFSTVFNNIYGNSIEYWSGIYIQAPVMNLRQMGVFTFILHNMMISFIIHLCIFTLYLVLIVWDCLITSKGKFMYYSYIFMQFTVLIVGYTVVSMHTWVFSALNFRGAIFTHYYFVICFIISVLYILVFLFFWIYSASRLFGPTTYFLKEECYANFYFFFASYRENKLARTYDLFFFFTFFLIGLIIGLLYDAPVAQLIIILAMLVLLFLVSLLLHPWRYILQFAAEMISLFLLIVVTVLLLVLAIYDGTGCFICGSRETSLCWTLVALIFLALIMPMLALILQTLFLSCCASKYQSWGKTVQVYSERDAFYGYKFGQQTEQIYTTDTNVLNEQSYKVNILKRDETDYIRVMDDPVEVCNCCNQAIPLCEFHGSVRVETCLYCNQELPPCSVHRLRRVQVYDSKKSMLEFMTQLRTKRQANNDRIMRLENDNDLSSLRHNISREEIRTRSQSKPRDANLIEGDRMDDELKQIKVLNALETERKNVSFVRNETHFAGTQLRENCVGNNDQKKKRLVDFPHQDDSYQEKSGSFFT